MIRILIIVAGFSLFTGCASFSYHSYSNMNGEVEAKSCYDGECHKLIGFGRIFFNQNRGDVVVQCANGPEFVYDHEKYRGYNCNRNQALRK